MTMYKVEICGVNTSKLPLLSTKEKEELIIKVKNGDKAARERYINMHQEQLLMKVAFLVR